MKIENNVLVKVENQDLIGDYAFYCWGVKNKC